MFYTLKTIRKGISFIFLIPSIEPIPRLVDREIISLPTKFILLQFFNNSVAFSLLIISYTSSSAFAEIDFDSGPLHERPLDEREQEDKHTEDIWTYAIAIVVVLLIIRLGFRIIKKRRQKKP